MEQAKIVFNNSKVINDIVHIERFTVVQNNKPQVIHVVDYRQSELQRQITFLNGVEATMRNGRYIKAQSKLEFCARLEFGEEDEQQ